ncbi:MAG: oxidoreductase [Cyclobacteriaceae bacterium]|nr:MAG: oxidoreductase [Cyclobacteriaceae bacterium]
MTKIFNRRNTLKTVATLSAGLAIGGRINAAELNKKAFKADIRLGVVGLAVHSAAFSKILNDPNKTSDLMGCRITALYHPPGNPDVDFTKDQLAKFRKQVEEMGVKIVASMDQLLSITDAILIETNDGRPHMEQVLPVLEAKKPVFVDKPVADTLENVIAIYEKARQMEVPIFSSSSLRYGKVPQEIRQSGWLAKGCNVYSPAHLEKSHTDLFWYGIHGVEMLYTVMGTGCLEVEQVKHSDTEDMVIGYWKDDRIGVFRGFRESSRRHSASYGGMAFLNDSITALGDFEGYRPLVVKIVSFFLTNQAPVSATETLEIYRFMEAAMRSFSLGGKKVRLDTV